MGVGGGGCRGCCPLFPPFHCGFKVKVLEKGHFSVSRLVGGGYRRGRGGIGDYNLLSASYRTHNPNIFLFKRGRLYCFVCFL